MGESPRWLAVVGQHQRALKEIKRAAAWNKVTLPPDQELLKIMDKVRRKVGCAVPISTTCFCPSTLGPFLVPPLELPIPPILAVTNPILHFIYKAKLHQFLSTQYDLKCMFHIHFHCF